MNRPLTFNPPTSPPAALLQGLSPVIDARTRLIVLGSFPGVASLQAGQYYAHPRNQFWPILSALWGTDLRALPYAERLEAMQGHGVGLWDVFAHCRREGSLDSAIRHAALNDLAGLKQRAPGLRAVAHNGATSARAGKAVASLASQGVASGALPSTSPAFAAWTFERKLGAWREFFTAHGVA
ncbi:MAG: hypothetical protein RLZZ618_4038 [Pseudomonadota bacterium]|jgi:hypoxanthine-DNA glycosylase